MDGLTKGFTIQRLEVSATAKNVTTDCLGINLLSTLQFKEFKQLRTSNVATPQRNPREFLHGMTCFSDASLDLEIQRLVMAEPATSPSLGAIQFIPRRSRQKMAALLG
jgi:hypothetical protein